MRKFALYALALLLLSACASKIDIAQTEKTNFADVAKNAAGGISSGNIEKVRLRTVIILPDDTESSSKTRDMGSGFTTTYKFPQGKIMMEAIRNVAPLYFENYTIIRESEPIQKDELNISLKFGNFEVEDDGISIATAMVRVKTNILMNVTDANGTPLFERNGISKWYQAIWDVFRVQEYYDKLAQVCVQAVTDSYADNFSSLSRTKSVADYIASYNAPVPEKPIITSIEPAAPSVEDVNLPPYREDAYAVVIGIDYKGRSDVPHLNYAAQDAKNIYSILTDKRYGGIDPANTTLLINEKATRNGIIAALRNLRTWKGYIYVYYSGHGAPITEGDAYKDAVLIPYDAVISDTASMDETSVRLSYLQDMVDNSKAEGVMVALDACFTGGGKSIVAKGGKPLVGMMVNRELIKTSGSGKVILTSSAGNQQSWEDDSEYKSGIFSHFLEEGMKGVAGSTVWVNVKELAAYVKDNVAKAAHRLKGEEQEPQLIGDGDFAVSRNWEKFKVADTELAKDKLKKAFTAGLINANQLSRAVGELSNKVRTKLLDAFLDGSLDAKNFGALY